ncbi:hypothetical protein BKA93DRAFT_830826 [Sparassis latifolia]|uniref:Pheromone-regulated membrane protein n=1 Tax=Sparassis crispa TaxID=139825 RepID=A0A401GBK8_9APHY|nr:Pheromone-regulated membrane protein [Sparassis crispa]GBE79531.1 Pheromone-regulated membrane protein [Sparassis crispa]
MSYTNVPPRRSALARRSSAPRTSANSSRSPSRVRFQDEAASRSTDARGRFQSSPAPQDYEVPISREQARDSSGGSPPEWNFPVYQNDYPSDHPAGWSPTQDVEPSQPQRTAEHSRVSFSAPSRSIESRRGSDESESTLHDEPLADDSKYSLSSYRHPYEIRPPSDVYTGPQSSPRGATLRRKVSFADDENYYHEKGDEDEDDRDIEGGCDLGDRDDRQRGILSNLIDLYGLNQRSEDDADNDNYGTVRRRTPGTERPWHLRRVDSTASNNSQVIDPDDPTVTGERKNFLDDPEDIEKNCLRQMSYKARRKERMRIKIEFNITSVLNRQMFLMRLAKALMIFGAPSHRIESQLLSAARILEVDAEFIHIPGVIICSFGDQDTKTSEMHFVKCAGRLALGSLHEVHQIYRTVVHDEISAKKATEQLNVLLDSKPLYGAIFRSSLAFFISALICPLAFGGSFLDMWIAGAGATILSIMQIGVASKSQLYANVFEITVTIFISFLARGLSSIRSQIFCYTAISSAGIVGILPGYLILSSSLELASKNIVCGSVKMVYALIYTLFLGFGLQIGSDLYLLFDQGARHDLATLAARMTTAVTITGTFLADNATTTNATDGASALQGTFTFTNSTPYIVEHIITGCYRPPSFPWYLQPFPWWSQFIIVPTFSILSSLANLQPFWTVELVVMVVISCVSYAANKIANHFIFNRSDVVSAIGAFAVGLLGNIYSRRMGGTAFTSMVTGVLFLVPSGLSQAGGITAQGNGIDIGGAMISVTIGITVGLFMSQAIVYMFGSRKNAAIFSF